MALMKCSRSSSLEEAKKYSPYCSTDCIPSSRTRRRRRLCTSVNFESGIFMPSSSVTKRAKRAKLAGERSTESTDLVDKRRLLYALSGVSDKSEILRKDLVHIENDDKVVSPFAHPLNEIRAPPHGDARRRLDTGSVQLNDFVDAIGDAAEHRRLAIDVEFHYDDARVHCIGPLREAEAQTEIHHRSGLASHVHHSAHTRRRCRHLRDDRDLQHLTSAGDIDGEQLVA